MCDGPVNEVTRTYDRPGDSLTDRAAGAAFDAIDQTLKDAGVDHHQAYAVVMVLVPDGSPTNSTVAGALPGGETSSEALLEHALTQLQVLARVRGADHR